MAKNGRNIEGIDSGGKGSTEVDGLVDVITGLLRLTADGVSANLIVEELRQCEQRLRFENVLNKELDRLYRIYQTELRDEGEFDFLEISQQMELSAAEIVETDARQRLVEVIERTLHTRMLGGAIADLCIKKQRIGYIKILQEKWNRPEWQVLARAMFIATDVPQVA